MNFLADKRYKCISQMVTNQAGLEKFEWGVSLGRALKDVFSFSIEIISLNNNEQPRSCEYFVVVFFFFIVGYRAIRLAAINGIRN